MAVRHRWKKIPVLQTNTVDRRRRSDLEEGVSALKTRFWNLASLVSNSVPSLEVLSFLMQFLCREEMSYFHIKVPFLFLVVLDGFRILFPSQVLNPGHRSESVESWPLGHWENSQQCLWVDWGTADVKCSNSLFIHVITEFRYYISSYGEYKVKFRRNI